ncbi:MAG: MFS transporter [Spirochaetes bacterium]|nr:MAG: MFS transporter [Spirochaetota bacterium]
MNEKNHSGEFPISRLSAWYILIVCSLLYMINYMDRQVLSITTEYIRGDLGLTDSHIGIIQTVFFMSMALFSFPVAFVVDRWSRKKTISIMAVLWSIFTLITGMGKSFAGILIPRALTGTGEAGFTSGGTPLIAAAFPREKRSMAMGIFNLAIPLGSALGILLGGVMAQRYGWRTPFYVFAVPGVILGLLALRMKDYKTVHHHDDTGRRIGFLQTVVLLFRIRTLKWLYLGYAMQNLMAFSFLTWGPAFYMRSHGADARQTGTAISIIGVMAIFGSIAGGIIADMWQRRNARGRMLTAAYGLCSATVLFVLMIYFDISGIGFAIGIGFGIFLVIPIPAISAVTQDVSPPALKGVSWGMNAFCCYVLGGGWAPLFIGFISDAIGGGAQGLKSGLLITAIGGLAGSMFYWLSSRSYPNDMEKIRGLTLEAGD